MKMHQHQLLLTFLSCCLLLVAADVTELPEEAATTDGSFEFTGDEVLAELTEPTDLETDLMMAHRINWLTFAQGSDDGKELLRLAPAVDADSRDGNACPISGERGLTGLIRNARPLLPADRLRNILANAREDPEVRDLLQLLRSEQFRERVTRLRNSKEEAVLRDYVCQTLKLNHAHYVEYVRLLFNAQSIEPVTTPLPNRRKGVRGLLLDLRDALPRAELRDLYRRQLTVDKDLSEAVRRIRGTEFRRLVANVRALTEYRAVRGGLAKAGVPLQQLLNLVASALGWGSLDLGSETEILIA